MQFRCNWSDELDGVRASRGELRRCEALVRRVVRAQRIVSCRRGVVRGLDSAKAKMSHRAVTPSLCR